VDRDPAREEVIVQPVEVVGAHLDLHERAHPPATRSGVTRDAGPELEQTQGAGAVAQQPELVGADLDDESQGLVEADRPVEILDGKTETFEPDVHDDTPRTLRQQT
jgi:hypothetical protein